MARVAVVTDSTADLPGELFEQNDIHMVPLSVRIGNNVYEDRVTISPSEFIEMLVSTGEFPTTSQPSVGQFQRMYTELASQYDAIISIHISSRLSGTYQSAYMARESLGDAIPISIIDSRSGSLGLGFPVLKAAELARQGCSLQEIETAVEAAIKSSHVLFLVDTLEYLRRGGRIGRAAEIVGSILQLKPILRVEEGIVVPHSRTRTRSKAMLGLADLVREFPNIGHLGVLSTAGTNDLHRFTGMLEEFCPPEKILIAEMSPVIAAHVGPGGIGVAIFEGEPFTLSNGAIR